MSDGKSIIKTGAGTSPVFNIRFPEQEFGAHTHTRISLLGQSFLFCMPTEIEHYTDEEILRDAERGIEDGRTHEDVADKEFEKAEDDVEFPKETEDEALQDILEYKGGHPEDWELTHRSSGEYMFDGSEMINTKTGESLTKQIENGFDDGYIAAHHDTLELLKGGESMIMLPDHEDEDGVLHVTHLLLGPDNSITYEIRSTKIHEREDEEIFYAEEATGRPGAHQQVEFYEETVITPEERVETVAETMEHTNETVFEGSTPVEQVFGTPITQEVTPLVAVEQRTETVQENPTIEVVNETKEETKETSWLSRFLRSESPTLAQEEHNSLESLPVFVGNTEVVEVGEQVILEVRSEVEVAPVVDFELPERVTEQVVNENDASHIEHLPASAQQTVEIQREIFDAIIEQKQPVVEVKPITLKIERSEPAAKIEQRPIVVKTPEIRHPEVVKTPEKVRPEIKREKNVTELVRSTPVRQELSKDVPTSFENSKKERVALSGNEILLRSLGIPTVSRAINARESMNPEALRSSRYSPPQNDNAPVQTTNRRSLNGIRMRRVA